MRITKRQLRKIIREMHPRAAADDAYVAELEEKEDELATQIRHASKDIYGTKDHYDLRGKSIEELEDILYDLANSQEQRYLDDEARIEMEDEMGYDSELSRAEMAPRRQGMSRRPAGSKSQRRMENKVRITKKQLQRIIKEEKARILREQEEISSQADHHWPRVDWKGVEELTDKWIDMEEKAWDKGDTSMNPDSKSDRDAQTYWNDQVEACAMDMEAEMLLRIRRVALQTMKEFSQKLIEGNYG